VPYELLNKKFRAAQKTIDREVSKVQGAGSELQSCLEKQQVTIGEVTQALDSVVEKLKMLKRKVSGQLIILELNEIYVCFVCERFKLPLNFKLEMLF